MKRFTRSDLIAELSWHFDDPGAALDELTEDERQRISRLGYMPKDLHQEVEARLKGKRSAS